MATPLATITFYSKVIEDSFVGPLDVVKDYTPEIVLDGWGVELAIQKKTAAATISHFSEVDFGLVLGLAESRTKWPNLTHICFDHIEKFTGATDLNPMLRILKLTFTHCTVQSCQFATIYLENAARATRSLTHDMIARRFPAPVGAGNGAAGAVPAGAAAPGAQTPAKK